MTKAEILALGVPGESVREFQTLYNRDLNKIAARAKDGPDPIRAAITAMVPMVRKPENLRQLLTSINFMYWVENQPIKGAAPGAANTEDGKAEREVTKTTNSTPIVGADGEGSQV